MVTHLLLSLWTGGGTSMPWHRYLVVFEKINGRWCIQKVWCHHLLIKILIQIVLHLVATILCFYIPWWLTDPTFLQTLIILSHYWNLAPAHEQDGSDAVNQTTASLGILCQAFKQHVPTISEYIYCVSKSPILSTMSNQSASSAVVSSFHWAVPLIPKMQQTQCWYNQSSLPMGLSLLRF